ncbi:LTA synthase family protein [Sulfitobacter marinus]|uniref:LTA synthase family protein n=1 Tax=Sulfitobacter marinus TaxID=394264 RepID=UPI001587C5BB|nr:alkaline phosphatase family protein [Sulfitobacter marinus]
MFEKVVCGYFAVLFLIYLAVLGVSPVKPEGFVWGVSTIGLPAFELAFFCILTLTLWRLRSKWTRYLVVLGCIFFPAVVGSFYLVQFISIVTSGRYITVLAMENSGEVAYITNTTTIALCVGMVSLIATIVFFSISEARKSTPGQFAGRSAIVGFALIFLMGIGYNERDRFVDHANNLGIPISLDTSFAPAIGMHKTYRKFSKVRFDANRIVKFVDDVASGDVESPFYVDVTADYPFQQTSLRSGPLPFVVKASSEPVNVIVLFLEGLSARALGHYGGPYVDLTPNLNRFAEQAVTIDSYYNHTAATYRGIQGSLSSGFPLAGGAGGWESSQDRLGGLSAISYATLPKILDKRGYDTKIYSPHSETRPFDDFLRAVGFEQVVTPEDVVPDNPPDFLSDRDLFAAMADDLQALEQSNNQTPFFWASYNIGSHAFLNTPSGAASYGDARNAALNRFHELDASLAAFLDAFEASTFADNTLLVITADHSSYAEPPVVEAFSDSAKFTTHFIDQIPLILHIPGVVEPMRFENGVRTSLDLTPTILNMMGVTEVEHAFLGTSIFDTQFRPEVNWGAIGRGFYRIDQTGVSFVKEDDASTQEKIVGSAIMYYNQLELEDKIFDPRL